MPASDKRSPSPRGLSLLELVVVLAIVGIVTALSVNSYLGFSDREKGMASLKGIQSQMNKARQLAVTRNQPVRITYTSPVFVSGRAYTAVRWEALPCTDAWGSTCPTPACAINPCGIAGCTCTTVDGGVPGMNGEVGPPGLPVPGLLVPAGTLTLPPALDGLCFEGGTGVPHLRNSGTDCQTSGTPPLNPNSFPFSIPTQSLPAYLQLEPITGGVKLLDCNASPDAGICP